MMPEQEFWEELRRLVRADDLDAAGELVNEQMQAFNEALQYELEINRPHTVH